MLADLLNYVTVMMHNKIRRLDAEIKKLPEGELLCVRNGKYHKWYKSNGIHPIYIPKSKHQYAEQLALKKYYLQQIRGLKKELDLLQQYVTFSENNKNQIEKLFQENSGYRELLKHHFCNVQKEADKWFHTEDVLNCSHPESLIHETLSGQFVRSKSEVMIANTLFLNEIPYRYERGITLDEIHIFPDFTIRHPKTGQIYYWEHFGLMDDSSYRDNAFNKLKIYGNNNIIPSFNLILTYETKMKPLSSNRVEKIVQENFC